MAETSVHPRPAMGTILKSDNNARGNFMELMEWHRALRHTKFPAVKGHEGHYDVPSFQARYKDSPAFIKWNKHAIAPHYGYPLAPHRDDHPIIAPTSGGISAGADEDLNTGIKKVPSMLQSGDKILNKTPPSVEVVTIPGEKEPPCMEMTPDEREALWRDRKVSDIKLRANSGGWTSAEKVIPKPTKEMENIGIGKFKFVEGNWRDEAAKKYMYTSATQNGFNFIAWDNKLPAKVRPRPSTMESMPDPISQRFTDWAKRYKPASAQDQRFGRSWDRFQTRDGNYPPRPVTFGSVGADNFEDKDNRDVDYNYFTAQRTPQPKYSETSHRPNIPKYTGCVHWVGVHSAHSQYPAPEPPSTAYVHRLLPTTPNTSPWAKRGPMSRMVTTVPPKNPFNMGKSVKISV